MYVVGSSKAMSARVAPSAASPRTNRPLNFSRKAGSPARAWSASATMKPTLWRLSSCSRPGLPRPTTRYMVAPPRRRLTPAGLAACAPPLLLLLFFLVVLLGVGGGGSRTGGRSRGPTRGARNSSAGGGRSARHDLLDFLLRSDDRDQRLLGGQKDGHALGQLEILRGD